MIATLVRTLDLLPISVWFLLISFVACLAILFFIRWAIDRPEIVKRLQWAFAAGPGGHRGTLAIPKMVYIVTLLLSVVIGVWIYVSLVQHFYSNLAKAYLNGDAINEITLKEPGALMSEAETRSLRTEGGDAQKKLLFRLLSYFNLNDSSREPDPASVWLDGSKNKATADSWKKAWANDPSDPTATLHQTVDLLSGLIVPGQSSECVKEYSELHKNILAAVLAGQPPADWRPENRWRPSAAIEKQKKKSDNDNLDCPEDSKKRKELFENLEAKVSLSRWDSKIIERPAELSNYEIIRLARSNWSTEATSDSDARDMFISRLMQELRGTDEVRGARRWVNGIIGWERLAVIVFAVWFSMIFVIRDFIQIPHLVHSRLIAAGLSDYVTECRKRKEWPDSEERATFANRLATLVTGGRTPANPGDLFGTVHTIPTRILSSAAAELNWRDSNFIETIADAERREISHSRVFFDAMLPTFPAIGFIGTVSSLLIAMSQADKIVSTIDPQAKGIAAGQVTDILSLCFSTTFMALMCVLIFSPLAVAQRAREDKLVDDTEAAVQLALRPKQP